MRPPKSFRKKRQEALASGPVLRRRAENEISQFCVLHLGKPGLHTTPEFTKEALKLIAKLKTTLPLLPRVFPTEFNPARLALDPLLDQLSRLQLHLCSPARHYDEEHALKRELNGKLLEITDHLPLPPERAAFLARKQQAAAQLSS